MNSPVGAERINRALRWVCLVAVVLAAVGIIAMAVVIVDYLRGFSAPATFGWIAWVALPMAFVLLMVGVALAAARRRRL